jgi:sulfonate transport system ATP-binding protein
VTRGTYVVTLDHVEKTFDIGGHAIKVFSDLTLRLAEYEFLTLLGPSGCGKTTLLKILAGLDPTYKGSISLWGQSPGDSARASLVFQESRLLPWYDVRTNVRLGVRRAEGDTSAAIESRVEQALEIVGLKGEFRRAWPHQLSAGMSKRVALARAIVNTPRLLLLDEPFSGLDIQVRRQLQRKLIDIHEQLQLSTILVTHDIEEAAYLSKRVVVLSPMPSQVVGRPFWLGSLDVRRRERPNFVDLCSQLLERALQASSERPPV